MCKRKQQVFFLCPTFDAKNNETIYTKFLYLCTLCTKSQPINQYYIPNAAICKILLSNVTKISKNIGNEQGEFGSLADFVAKFELVSQEGKNELLTKLGKQGRLKCEYCDRKPSKARCSKCHITRYCSQACNEANWKTHKETCKRIANKSLFLDKIVGWGGVFF